MFCLCGVLDNEGHTGKNHREVVISKSYVIYTIIFLELVIERDHHIYSFLRSTPFPRQDC